MYENIHVFNICVNIFSHKYLDKNFGRLEIAVPVLLHGLYLVPHGGYVCMCHFGTSDRAGGVLCLHVPLWRLGLGGGCAGLHT